MLFFHLLLAAAILACVASMAATTVTQSSWINSAVTSALRSPLARPIVNAARNTMVKTATSVGVDWTGKAAMLTSARPDWDAVVAAIANENGPTFTVPEYYKQPFHAYDDGNLCLQAAVEQELAGKAVGARNFPDAGINGEVKIFFCALLFHPLMIGTDAGLLARVLRDAVAAAGRRRAGPGRDRRGPGLRHRHQYPPPGQTVPAGRQRGGHRPIRLHGRRGQVPRCPYLIS